MQGRAAAHKKGHLTGSDPVRGTNLWGVAIAFQAEARKDRPAYAVVTGEGDRSVGHDQPQRLWAGLCRRMEPDDEDRDEGQKQSLLG
jgi:hypothetical protein